MPPRTRSTAAEPAEVQTDVQTDVQTGVVASETPLYVSADPDNDPAVVAARADGRDTARVGDASEYRAELEAARLAARPSEGHALGNVSAENVYESFDGKLYRTTGADVPDGGSGGFRGSLLVAQGDVIGAYAAQRLAQK